MCWPTHVFKRQLVCAVLTALLPPTRASFDFLVLDSLTSAATGDQICRSLGYDTLTSAATGDQICRRLGYDGLAVVNTPESYAYLVRITEERRKIGKGVNIGLHVNAETVQFEWSDGRAVTVDTPWYVLGTQPSLNKPRGRIHHSSARISLESGRTRIHTACGNYLSPGALSVAFGNTLRHLEAVHASSHQSQSQTRTYLECALLCASDYRCRMAAFSSDTSQCRVLGPETGAVDIRPKHTSTLFVRSTF
ncbi:hypothetical protein EGW08_018381 [Elysia chlorotica]|uniref:Apple domain-containing protein n=1 Tax=Elysia chlorotica TaxID=188477 RepID=A0A3S0ZBE8_ELYCH|nr:hypothetical protein EGW08_018381 [Elysia chlorotica]